MYSKKFQDVVEKCQAIFGYQNHSTSIQEKSKAIVFQHNTKQLPSILSIYLLSI